MSIWPESYDRDDVRNDRMDDDYWYHLWLDSRLEDEYGDHLGI